MVLPEHSFCCDSECLPINAFTHTRTKRSWSQSMGWWLVLKGLVQRSNQNTDVFKLGWKLSMRHWILVSFNDLHLFSVQNLGNHPKCMSGQQSWLIMRHRVRKNLPTYTDSRITSPERLQHAGRVSKGTTGKTTTIASPCVDHEQQRGWYITPPSNGSLKRN